MVTEAKKMKSKTDILQLVKDTISQKKPLRQALEDTGYDEIFEVDLSTGHYEVLSHTSNKFMGNLLHGDFEKLYSFALEHFVHPEDVQAYREDADISTFEERFEKADPKGVIINDYRLKGTDGNWIRTRQLFASGEMMGKDDDLVSIYVWDLDEDEEGDDHYIREEVTGLLEGMNFLRPAQKLISSVEEGWCMIDIDIVHHKLFSDWFGLDQGQYLLTQVAEVLNKFTEQHGGLPGYMGQEEFCLLIPYDKEAIDNLQKQLQDLISSVSHIRGFTPAMGIAMIDGTGEGVAEYFNRAALTVEDIKNDLNVHIKIYDSELHKRNSEEYRLLNEFEDAIKHGYIDFWLQPQCRVPDYKVVGAEALARWHHKDGGFVSPAFFVPILEKYSIVVRLDTFIWEEVCKWIRKWIDSGKKNVPISINISRIDIFSIDVPEYMLGLINKYGLSTDDIKIEITESAYAKDADKVGETIRRLQEMGFLVLMDDFGSGYSSLNMLRSCNVDVIKLDAQFLKIGKQEEQKGISILESILNMTRNLATPIIVEGVETEAQLKYLSDLGCSYMQGFYFHKPMPLDEFEKLIYDESNIDTHGFMFKANQQLQIREFLDKNIYSEAMLNNIIGPVVFYNWNGEDIDIIRYNQQFFELVGIDLSQFRERKIHIQNTMYPGDDKKLYELLQEAYENHINGAKGVVRAYKPDGTVMSLSLQMYFIGENDQGKQYYVSAHDVSELQYINSDFPGGYFRCTTDETFEFMYISLSFQKLTGYSEEEIVRLFDGKLINMIHPDDRERLLKETREAMATHKYYFTPYRLKNKNIDYIYVAEQTQLSQNFGVTCWQSVGIDVTETMKTRNQMKILSNYLSDTVLFLINTEGYYLYEVAIHGLKDVLMMSSKEFEIALNSGAFCKMIEGHEDIPHQEYTKLFIGQIIGGRKEIKVKRKDGKLVHLEARADRVESNGPIEYIVILHSLD